MSTRDEVETAMGALRHAAPALNPTIDNDTIDLWTVALARYPAAALVAATEQWVCSPQRFPLLGEFRAAVRRAADELAGPQVACAGCPGTPGLVEEGLWTGTVWHSDGWRPCQACNPRGYERWVSGRYAPVVEEHGPAPLRALMAVTDTRRST